jgi:hypothetical protein
LLCFACLPRSSFIYCFCVSYFTCHCDPIPDRNNLMEEGFTLAHGFIHSYLTAVHLGKSSQRQEWCSRSCSSLLGKQGAESERGRGQG